MDARVKPEQDNEGSAGAVSQPTHIGGAGNQTARFLL